MSNADQMFETFASIARIDHRRIMAEANQRDLLIALKAASGYLLNAKIDLETGAPKKTAIQTIEGGLKVVQEAIAKAERVALAHVTATVE